MFIDKICKIYNKCCPLKKIKVKNKVDIKPWLSQGLINATKKKRLLYEQSLRYGTKKAEDKYKRYKNKLTYILRCEQKRYYSKLLAMHKNDMKKTWQVLNQCMGKNKSRSSLPKCFKVNNVEINDSEEIANGFNNFFVNVGPSLAENIPKSDEDSFKDYIQYKSGYSMFLEPTCAKEIMNIIKTFQSKDSYGHDGLSMKIVKIISEVIAGPFSHVCNRSFESGVFPDKMKLAKIVPIFKSGDNQVYTNYRPVSLLPQFSKVLEKLFNNRLMSYINKNNILYNGQYGFRQNFSTSLAILDLIEEITTSIDNHNVTVGVFIDLKKAFDTIDHSILLKKLEIYGIRGIAANWLNSYLSDRKQFVQYSDVNSNDMAIKCGIPQGSIIGPSLFILYINDLHNVSKILNFILFADDTNIFLSGKNLTEVCDIMTSELKKLDAWFKVNKLSLNVSKTNYMVFGKTKGVSDNCHIYINDVELEQVSSTKFLGVYIDDKLNWHKHILHVENKIAKSLSIMYKVKYLLDEAALLTIYTSLILPYLNYCIEIWGNTYPSNLKGIIVLQKRALRIIGKVEYKSHTNSLFIKFRVLKLLDIVKFNTCVVMYKAFYGSLDSRLSKRFAVNKSNTRQSKQFYVQYKRTKLKSFSISCTGVSLWNNLDIAIRESKTIILFKKSLKRVYIKNYQCME